MKSLPNPKRTLLIVFTMLFSLQSKSQSQERVPQHNDYLMPFRQLADTINAYYKSLPEGKKPGYKPWKRNEWFALHHLGQNGDVADVYKENMIALSQLEKELGNNTRSVPNGNWSNYESYIYQDMAFQGRINSITFDPLNPAIAFIATAGGGIWKTQNYGDGWFNVTKDLPALGFADVAIAPVPNTHIIYALPGDISGGANVYLHNSIGILKSYDFGATWRRTNGTFPLSAGASGHKLLVHPTDHNNVLAAMSYGIQQTTDGGNSWNMVTPNYSVSDMEFHPTNPNLVYYTVFNSNIFYTLNLTTGAITSSVVPSTILPVSRMEIAVTPNNSNAVYVQAGPDGLSGGVAIFGGLFVSTNGGPFTLITNALSNNWTAFGGQSSYNNVLFIDPNNASHIMIGGVNLYNSTNGGVDWTMVTTNSIHADHHNLKFNPFSGDFWLCNDGGVYRSTDNGVTWINKSNGLFIHEYYRISGTSDLDDRIIGGTQDNGHFLKYVGNYLHRVIGGDGMDSYFNSWNDSIVYACTQNGDLNRSINHGLNWYSLSIPNGGNGSFYPWITPIVQHPPSLDFGTGQIINTDVIYVYSFNGILRSSADILFSSWANIGPPGIGQVNGSLCPSMGIGLTGGITSLYVSNGNNFWVCHNPLTGDASCWENHPLPISASDYVSSLAVNPANREEVWVTISGYTPGVKVYRTSNSGLNWYNVSLDLPNIPVYSIVFANPDNNPTGAVYIGTELGVFYTDNTLVDWVPFMNGLPHVAVTDLQINYMLGKLKASTYGRGIWETETYQPCSWLVNLDTPINSGQYHFESSNIALASSVIEGGIGTSVRIKAADRVTLLPNFHILPDSYMRIQIGPCGSGPVPFQNPTDNPDPMANVKTIIQKKEEN